MPLTFLTIAVFQASPWEYNRGLTETGGELTFASAVAVTSARRTDPLRPARTQCRFQFLFHDSFDHPGSGLEPPSRWCRAPTRTLFPYSLPAIPFHRRHLPLLACQRVRVFDQTR